MQTYEKYLEWMLLKGQIRLQDEREALLVDDGKIGRMGWEVKE